MKLFETSINGGGLSYVVGKNNVTKITKTKDIVKVTALHDEYGEVTAQFDLGKLPYFLSA